MNSDILRTEYYQKMTVKSTLSKIGHEILANNKNVVPGLNR